MKKLLLLIIPIVIFGCCTHKVNGTSYTYNTKGGQITEDSFRRIQQMVTSGGTLDTSDLTHSSIAITGDTAFATWLGPDSVMFIMGHGVFTDTVIITNPKHKYKK